MMMVNGTVWWFVGINVIGFFIFWRWFEKQARESGLTLLDLGISYRDDRFVLDWAQIGKTNPAGCVPVSFCVSLRASIGEHLYRGFPVYLSLPGHCADTGIVFGRVL